MAFQYMPPTRGGNRLHTRTGCARWWFQYMPPTRGGNKCGSIYQGRRKVSIHAPHAGGQPEQISRTGAEQVSIHAPHAGGQLPLVALPA